MWRISSALTFSFANSFSIFLIANDENRSCDIVVLSQVLMHLMAEKFLSHPAELIGIPIANYCNYKSWVSYLTQKNNTKKSM